MTPPLDSADLDRIERDLAFATDTWSIERLRVCAQEIPRLIAALREERTMVAAFQEQYEDALGGHMKVVDRAEKADADASLVRAQSQAVIRDLAALRLEHERLGDLQGKTAEHNLAMHARVEKAEAERDMAEAQLKATVTDLGRAASDAIAERDAARLHTEALERMISDLADELPDGANPEWHYDQIRTYAEADEAGKADIRAFHLSTGPAKVRDAVRRLDKPEAEGGSDA